MFWVRFLGRYRPLAQLLRAQVIGAEGMGFDSQIGAFSDGGSISKVGGGGPKPMTRFSSSTTKDGIGVARNFKRGGGIISTFFSAYFFRQN